MIDKYPLLYRGCKEFNRRRLFMPVTQHLVWSRARSSSVAKFGNILDNLSSIIEKNVKH